MKRTGATAFAACAPVLARHDGLFRGRCTVRRPVRVRPAGNGPRMAGAAPRGGSGAGYWRGEWICVDCGYVYKPGRKVKFEDLPNDWKCPQCNAPKRRFAKKAGSVIQETAGTSNAPIVIFSILGICSVFLLFWVANQL